MVNSLNDQCLETDEEIDTLNCRQARDSCKHISSNPVISTCINKPLSTVSAIYTNPIMEAVDDNEDDDEDDDVDDDEDENNEYNNKDSAGFFHSSCALKTVFYAEKIDKTSYLVKKDCIQAVQPVLLNVHNHYSDNDITINGCRNFHNRKTDHNLEGNSIEYFK